MYMTLSLPSASSASFIARIEPSASPSGFSCVTSRKRSFARIASAAARSSAVTVARSGADKAGTSAPCEPPSSLRLIQLVDQLAHPHARLDARVVFEGKCRGSLQPQLARETRLQDAVRRSQPFERPLPYTFGPENADEDPRVTEIGRGLDSGQGDEADAWILQLRQSLGQHLSHRLVHPAHPPAHP